MRSPDEANVWGMQLVLLDGTSKFISCSEEVWLSVNLQEGMRGNYCCPYANYFHCVFLFLR